MTTSRYVIHGHVRDGVVADLLDAVAVDDRGAVGRVLIKRLRAVHDEGAIDQFLDEARVLERLAHPNIVRLRDAGVVDGQAFLVFDFVPGLDLADVLDRCRSSGRHVPEDLALHVIERVGQALGFAHAAPGLRVVHRDVSPANIMISWEGHVVLADFGIALFEDRTPRTQAGLAKGKLGYMAPEQVLGSDVDARADVFGAGCVLHEMLTGRSPIATEDQQRQMLLGERVAIDPSIEAPRELLLQALAIDRRQRPKDGTALAEQCAKMISVPAEQARLALARWLIDLVSGTEERLTEVQTITASFELVPPTAPGARGIFVRSEPSSQTVSNVISFLEETTKAETLVKTKAVPSRRTSKPSKNPWPLLATISLASLAIAVALLSTHEAKEAVPLGASAPAATALPVATPIHRDEPPKPPPPEVSPAQRPSRSKPTRAPSATEPAVAAPLKPLPLVAVDARALDRALEEVRASLVAAKVAGASAPDLARWEAQYLGLSSAEAEATTQADRSKLAAQIRELIEEIGAPQ